MKSPTPQLLRQSPPEFYPGRVTDRYEVYGFCDGQTHRYMEIGRGVYEVDLSRPGMAHFFQDTLECDEECRDWREVKITELPVHVRVGLGYGFQVPANTHFVHQRRFGAYTWTYTVNGPGAYIPAETWEKGFLLEPGDTRAVCKTYYFELGGTTLVTLTNNNGKIEVDDPSKPLRVKFAQERLEQVVRSGFRRSRALHITRAAGPRFCLEAVDWAQKAYDEVSARHTCDSAKIGILKGLVKLLKKISDSTDLGRDWVDARLKDLGVTPPDARSNVVYFKILQGAFYALEWWRNEEIRGSAHEEWRFPMVNEEATADVSTDRDSDHSPGLAAAWAVGSDLQRIG